MSGPRGRAVSPDAGVRPAAARDVQAIAAIQVRAWRTSYADVLPATALASLDESGLTPAWHAAVTQAPTSRHRVMVATSRDMVTGFAAVAPATDPDSTAGDVELVALEIDPAHRVTGHGSRLLNAAVDTSRDDGAAHIVTWVPVVDTARATFLTRAGLAADGAERVRADGEGVTWAERRMAATLDGAA